MDDDEREAVREHAYVSWTEAAPIIVSTKIEMTVRTISLNLLTVDPTNC
jgi:hypothetical protein